MIPLCIRHSERRWQINIGERADSGVLNIFNVWEDEGWEKPEIEEKFEPDRTILTLSFVKNVTVKRDSKKATVKDDSKKVTKKTQMQYDTILAYMKSEEWYKASEFVEVLGVKETRIKELLRALAEDGKIIDNGKIKGRSYRKI